MTTECSGHGLTELSWRKSSYSDSHGGNCVEVAACLGAVHVRDSKDMRGPQLAFGAQQWATFLAGVRGTG